MRGQNEAVKQPLVIHQKGGIESARMPADSPVCVGRLDDDSERDKQQQPKKTPMMIRINRCVLETLVALFGSPAPTKVYILVGEGRAIMP